MISPRKRLEKEERHIKNILKKNLEKARVKKFLALESNLLNKQLLLSKLDDETLHSIRKILKDILYAQLYILNDQKTELPSWLSSQENVKLLTDLLRDFQDACVGLFFLKGCYIDRVPEGERIFLMKIEKEWQDEKENIRKEVYGLLKKN